jgi:hypothetical protein
MPPDQIRFETEEQTAPLLYSRLERSAQVPAMLRWVLSTGIVKTDQAARYVLLAITALAVILAVLIAAFYSGGSAVSHDPYKNGQSVLGPSQNR